MSRPSIAARRGRGKTTSASSPPVRHRRRAWPEGPPRSGPERLVEAQKAIGRSAIHGHRHEGDLGVERAAVLRLRLSGDDQGGGGGQGAIEHAPQRRAVVRPPKGEEVVAGPCAGVRVDDHLAHQAKAIAAAPPPGQEHPGEQADDLRGVDTRAIERRLGALFGSPVSDQLFGIGVEHSNFAPSRRSPAKPHEGCREEPGQQRNGPNGDNRRASCLSRHKLEGSHSNGR